MTKHSRGNTSLRHNTVQNMLIEILEQQPKAWVGREKTVCSMRDINKYWVIDILDQTDRAHPVYYEVESSQSLTDSTKQKQKALAKHNRIDLVIIPVWKINWDKCSLGDIEKWLRELIH